MTDPEALREQYFRVLQFARERHAGQKYGGTDYVEGHLLPVVDRLRAWGFTKDHLCLLFAGLLHDIVEDTATSIGEVRALCGDDVADIVWAVTCEPGRNRKERHAATYPKIRRAGRLAVILKVVDRIMNVESCWDTRDSKLYMYQREYRDFRAALRREEDGADVISLWDHLDKLSGWYEPRV